MHDLGNGAAKRKRRSWDEAYKGTIRREGKNARRRTTRRRLTADGQKKAWPIMARSNAQHHHGEGTGIAGASTKLGGGPI